MAIGRAHRRDGEPDIFKSDDAVDRRPSTGISPSSFKPELASQRTKPSESLPSRVAGGRVAEKVLEIEARPYGPESSEAERGALRNRASLVEDLIVLFRAVPVPTRFQLDLAFDRIEELTAGGPTFALIIDLTEGQRPSAEVRAHLRQRFSSLVGLAHTSVFVGPNFVLTVAARFVLHGAGHSSVTFHRRYEDALEAARRALAA